MHPDDEEKRSVVTIEAKYLPVPIKLDPRESVNSKSIFFLCDIKKVHASCPDQGVLRCDLLYGREIHGADRSGKSDPFVVFQLNGQKVFKSQTKKKTVNPDWNEDFVFPVVSE